ncbi:MAG: GNAT family N-acetyltransferase [Anditalea sp.]
MKDSANVGLLAVSMEFRGLGIGKQLIQAICSLAGRQGVKSLTISTQRVNHRAVSLYLNAGFVVDEEISVYHWWDY